MAFDISVNGKLHSVDVDGDTPILWVLRDVLGMIGTKFGCGMALCGACTVHVDGSPARSCITSIDSMGTSEITTIEAIGATQTGAKIQKAHHPPAVVTGKAKACRFVALSWLGLGSSSPRSDFSAGPADAPVRLGPCRKAQR